MEPTLALFAPQSPLMQILPVSPPRVLGSGQQGSNGPGHQNPPPSSWWGVNDEAKATILHLRESLVQQKEIILDQRETIRELTAKLTMCEGFGRGVSPHSHHHPHTDEGHYSNPPGHHGNAHLHPDSPVYPSSAGGHKSDGVNHQGKEKHMTPGDSTSSTEQMERMLLVLKERLDNLQKRNSSTAYSSSLRELLQRKISTLEGQLHHHNNPEHHDDDATHRDDGDHPADNHHNDDHKGDAGHEENHTDHHDDDDNQDLDGDHDSSGRKNTQSLDAFQISFPMRTNYMHGRVKRTLLQEIFALTLCLWMKAGVGPGLGTPFSYSAPGQANELVLIEWGNNPIELLIDDKAVTLPLSLSDGKWHHVCVTWTTRDGQWEAYQDGVQKGTGTNLSPWHAIKPGGVFILGQEQDTLGGRFDATQSYVGEMSELHMWSRVLSADDIYSLASCGSHLQGDVIAWSETEVELHGGVARYPFDSCH
ncbi:Neuronal pentraxin-2 [Oryzias melastigma]|uniref:Neuronal pentraxin-2 n=1 Tax=Oryzias melastigma TaxID=30732 RepID=A0A834L2Z0_ORYME|nr:Neuronal pentraxin-2 [Oryzias melastigma]